MNRTAPIVITVLTAFVGMSMGCGGPEESEDTVSATQSPLLTFDKSPAVVYDGATQCTVGGTTMHCCPSGKAMIGARLDMNVFKCAPLANTTGVRTLDTFTQRNGMHSCPFGQVMVGLHLGLNRLACQTVPDHGRISEIVDTGTQDAFPMHVCDNFSTMSGIRADFNRLNCATDFVIP